MSSSVAINLLKPTTSNAKIVLSFLSIRQNPQTSFIRVFKTKCHYFNKNATDHQDFELHLSEESKLVVKILQFAGVSMKDYNLVQIAGQKEASTTQQEKQ